MFDPELIKLIVGAVLLAVTSIGIWIKGGSSMRDKITRKRTEQNAKSSVEAKERLIDITNADDNEYLASVRDSERG